MPVIAVLHGAVIGGGLELAAAAHIRVAEHGAYYALPEGTRGIFVGAGGAVRIPRLIGTARMIDMMLTGRTYSASDGASLGFSQYLVGDGQGLARAIALAEGIAANAVLSNFAIVQALPRISRDWAFDGKSDDRDRRERRRSQGAAQCLSGEASAQDVPSSRGGGVKKMRSMPICSKISSRSPPALVPLRRTERVPEFARPYPIVFYPSRCRVRTAAAWSAKPGRSDHARSRSRTGRGSTRSGSRSRRRRGR